MVPFLVLNSRFIIFDSESKNLAKLGKLDLETHTTLKFTQSFMDIGQILLLSENVKFQIDKATIVPSRLQIHIIISGQ